MDPDTGSDRGQTRFRPRTLRLSAPSLWEACPSSPAHSGVRRQPEPCPDNSGTLSALPRNRLSLREGGAPPRHGDPRRHRPTSCPTNGSTFPVDDPHLCRGSPEITVGPAQANSGRRTFGDPNPRGFGSGTSPGPASVTKRRSVPYNCPGQDHLRRTALLSRHHVGYEPARALTCSLW